MDVLLDDARRLPPIQQRAVAAIVGAIVADAAGNYTIYYYSHMNLYQ